MIFLDNASTTKLKKEARAEINKSLDLFYNPSALYSAGLNVKNKINESKKLICKALGTKFNDNLVFTASATEANNLAIFGGIKKTQEQLLFSMGEHPSVHSCALELIARGFNVKFIPLTKEGKVDIEALESLLNKPTAFVSTIHVSNETGAINDVAQINKIIRRKQPNAIFHSDGVQAFGKIPVNVASLGVDFYTISAHKVGGPKGIGALYAKSIKKLKPVVFGGGQEFGIRSGTENTLYILAFGQIAQGFDVKEDYKKVCKLNKYVRGFFLETAKKDNLSVDLNSSEDSSPYILSISFNGVRAETLVHMLEDENVIVGAGSACSSKKGASNRILEAMGKTKSQNQGAIRISFSPQNTLKEVKDSCEIIIKVYSKLLKKIT